MKSLETDFYLFDIIEAGYSPWKYFGQQRFSLYNQDSWMSKLQKAFSISWSRWFGRQWISCPGWRVLPRRAFACGL